MWYLAIYQDWPEGPMYEGSAHRSAEAAEAAKAKALADPWWREYHWSVVPASRLPRTHETVEDVMLQAGEEEKNDDREQR